MRISDWSSDVCSSDLLPAMRGHGYAVLGPDAVAGLCGVAVADLDTLKPSWDALPPDEYLLDGGSYRRRRHACFVVDDGRLERAPHRAHWQSKDYNALHGGLRRWFEPVSDARSEEHTSELQSLMRISSAVFCLKQTTHHSTISDSNDHMY